MSINKGLDKLGEHMALRKYLYRDDEKIFERLEKLQKVLKKSTLRAILTEVIVKGMDAVVKENNIIENEEGDAVAATFVVTED